MIIIKNLKSILTFVVVPLILIVFFASLWGKGAQSEKLKYSQLLDKFRNDEVASYELNLSTGKLKYTLRSDKDKKVVTYNLASAELFIYDIRDINEKLLEKDNKTVDVSYDYESGGTAAVLTGLIPYIVMFGIIILFWVIMMRRMGTLGGGDKTLNFGKAKFRNSADDKKKTKFTDVAGADEEKEELAEIVEFLKNPQKFNELGARIPKGVLLVGPPGTGKTLLAKAVAGEAGVPFFSISGSDFVEMFVGVGASRVRDLFEQAKKNSPAIVFIDEIDAVGRQRGAGLGGGHDEREQTLNQLLVEMDGFGANEGVIIIAATNRPDVLDKALLRPGRFDRQIAVNYPDVKGREDILKVHSRGKPLGPDVDLKKIAQSTSGFTGADLENLLNEAALLAARNGQKSIIEQNIEEATVKVMMGTEKKSHIVTDRDKWITCCHEAGHAIVSYFLPTQDPVHQISIIQRGLAAGYTMYLPENDDRHITRGEILESICSLLGGRAAELLTQDDICTGASNDIKRATENARNMVTKYGFSDKIGPIAVGNDQDEVFLGRDFTSTNNCSQELSSLVDSEIEGIVNSQYKKAVDILKENLSKLLEISSVLFNEEKIDGDRFRALMASGGVPQYPVPAISKVR